MPSQENIDAEMDSMFADVDEINNAAQKIMSTMSEPVQKGLPPTTAVNPTTPTQSPGIKLAPPTQAKETEEDIKEREYKKEKQELFKLADQLSNLANSDTNGEIVRNFGMSQLVIRAADDWVRLNGLIILRALKVKCRTRIQSKKEKNIDSDQAGFQEQVSQSLYEVWGEMDDGSLGLTSSYAPSEVVSIIDLNSGYDISPDG